MKFTLITLGALATSAALSAQTDAPPRSFFNVSAAYAFLGDFDDTTGFALNAGSTISGPHGWEASVAYFDSGVLGSTAKFTPILAGYRYTYQDASAFSCYVSALVGVTLEKYEFVPLTNQSARFSESDQAFTAGAKIGAEWHFSRNWSLDGNYTFLRLQETDITESGNISYLAASVNYRF